MTAIEFPPLAGSEKQVAYGADVRDRAWRALVLFARSCGFEVTDLEAATVFTDLMIDGGAALATVEKVRALLRRFATEASAKWWIEIDNVREDRLNATALRYFLVGVK